MAEAKQSARLSTGHDFTGGSPNPLFKEMITISENRKRNITLTVRLTEKEKQQIAEKAQKANMNLTEYIVTATNNVLIVVPEDLKPAVSEMKKMGNNINQIARKINSGAVRSYNFDEVISNQADIISILQEIADANCEICKKLTSK